MAAGKQCEELRNYHSVSLAEQLARQFYDWEIRGRGWLLWDEPVRIEPPFEPFWGYQLTAPDAGDDDGRRQTWVSGLIQWLSRKLRRSRKNKGDGRPDADQTETINTLQLSDTTAPIELQVTLPPEANMGTMPSADFS